MSFLTPVFLALSALALPIVVLYMLKLRRREVEVSSTLLWQLLLRDREANSPWQRLRRNLLLFLQLLLLAALVLALARPFWPVPTIATGTLVVLLDGSASMNATDAGGTRFEAARAAVRQLIDGLGPDGNMALILVGQQPAVLVPTTSSKDALRDGLAQARPAETPADWEAAVALATGAVRAGAADESIVVIVSDGGLPAGLPPLPAEVRYVPIGSSADNLAIEALALRPAANGAQLFALVANYGAAERAVIISFYLDGQLFSAEQVSVAPGGTAQVVLDELPARPAVYQARLSLPATGEAADDAVDQLPLDDSAFAVYQPPSAGRVLLITPGNVFLEQVFTALSGNLGLSPFRLKAGQPLPAEPFDLYVFDGVISGTLPVAADLLLVNPSSNELFQVGGAYTATTPARVLDDPLTNFVDWTGVHLLKASDIPLPAWARPLVQTAAGPLVFAGEQGGRRVGVLAFDLHDSNLPLQVTFPILMANLLSYLSPPQAFAAGDGLRPGDVLTIKPSAGATVVAIADPAGDEFAAQATEAGVIFAQTQRLGLYTVRTNQGVLGQFAVNLFDPAESAIAPAATIRLGRADVTAAAREAQGEFEIWPWLAAVALALLFVEWWVYHRGNVLPKLPRKSVASKS